jgi:GTPase
MYNTNEKIKTGMVALVGPPNVGKSTLLNNLLGQKISIVSPRPQTTRNRILGILNNKDYQIVLLDTPGLHKAHSPLNLEMVKIAQETLKEVELILFMVDSTDKKAMDSSERSVAEFSADYLKESGNPAILLINKIDLLDKEKLFPLITSYQKLFPFKAIIPISAFTGDGLDSVLDEILAILPDGPRLYPEDIPTDSTERFIVAEIIREKIFLLTNKEIPYSTAVVIDDFKEKSSGKVVIQATIIVEKKSQKPIIIGKGAKKLKQIKQTSRLDIEALLAQRVDLRLWVKVQKNWTKNPRFLQELGF